MIHTAQLPMSYWEFAMLTACHLHNRIYHIGVNGIPVTLANGHTPDLQHLRIFGCPAFVHIPADQRRKMTDTAFQGILVGYPTDTYGYLVYNPRTRRVVTTRHVRFDETFNGRLSEEGTPLPLPHPTQSTQPPITRLPTYSSSDSDDEELSAMPQHPANTSDTPPTVAEGQRTKKAAVQLLIIPKSIAPHPDQTPSASGSPKPSAQAPIPGGESASPEPQHQAPIPGGEPTSPQPTPDTGAQTDASGSTPATISPPAPTPQPRITRSMTASNGPIASRLRNSGHLAAEDHPYLTDLSAYISRADSTPADPLTHRAAMKSPHAEEWWQAELAELAALKDRRV